MSIDSVLQNFRNISETQMDFIKEAALYLTLACSVYYILFGTVLSVSNMVGDILKSTISQSSRMKLTFISGLIFCSALIKNLYHEHLTSFDPFDSPSYTQKTSAVRLIFAGLLVGFGSQYAKIGTNNSFSLDGVPQFSLKSIAGSLLVFVSACLTHTYALHKYLPQTPRIIEIIELPDNYSYAAYLLVFMLIPFVCYIFSSKKSFKMLICYLALFTVGVFYAYCLMFGGFVERKVFYTYLTFPEKQSSILLTIYGYGIIASGFIYILMRFIMYFCFYFSKKPLFESHSVRDDSGFKYQLIIGSLLYGIGWGLGGLGVASLLVLLPLESIKIVFYWGLACLIGMKFSHKVFEQTLQEQVVAQQKKVE